MMSSWIRESTMRRAWRSTPGSFVHLGGAVGGWHEARRLALHLQQLNRLGVVHAIGQRRAGIIVERVLRAARKPVDADGGRAGSDFPLLQAVRDIALPAANPI